MALLLVPVLIGVFDSDRPEDWRVAPHPFATVPLPQAGRVPAAELEAAVERGTDYLVNNCRENGKFVYARDLERPRFQSPDYNVLRHAGAIYALCQRQAWQPNEKVEATIQRAVTFLQRETFMRLPGREDLLAVWSPPQLVGGGGPLEAKLGGTGLGLAALLAAESISPGATRPEDLIALGDFLRFMQRPDGDFYSKFVPSAGGRRNDWNSLYYPGEAALGLVRLYEHSGEPRFLTAACQSLLFLANSRAGRTEVPADHWALLATAELMSLTDASLSDAQRQRLIEHGAQVSRSMLSERRPSDRSPYTFGSFNVDGRTTPTATRVEGLLAALTFLPPELDPLRLEIEQACDEAVRFLLASQCREGPFAGAMPHGIGRLRPLWGNSTRSFNRHASEVRVDYVQHALSAWIQYIRYDPVDKDRS